MVDETMGKDDAAFLVDQREATGSQFVVIAVPSKQELFLADGLHMSDAGYQIWVDMLRPQLDKLLAASGDAQE